MATKSKVDTLGAARLFIMARGRGGENVQEDTLALAILLEEFAKAGFQQGLEANIPWAEAIPEEQSPMPQDISDATHEG